MSEQMRHTQLFNLLKAESSDTNPDNKPVSLDDETALMLLRRARNSWLRPAAADDRMELSAIPKGDYEFFGTVRT